MKIQFEIKNKQVFVAVLIVSFILSLVVVLAAWDATKKVWHSAADVKVTVGGADKSLQEAISDGSLGGGGGGTNNLDETTEFIDGQNWCYTYWRGCGYGDYVDETVLFSRTDIGVKSIRLTTTDNEYTDWPARDTVYIFDGGADTGVGCGGGQPSADCLNNLPFNREVLVWDYNNNKLWLTVNVRNPSNPGSVATVPVSFRVRSEDISGGHGGVRLKIKHEKYYLTYKGVRLGILD